MNEKINNRSMYIFMISSCWWSFITFIQYMLTVKDVLVVYQVLPR